MTLKEDFKDIGTTALKIGAGVALFAIGVDIFADTFAERAMNVIE